MVLLLLTDPLIARLQHVVPQLPAELAAQLSLHLDSVPSPTDAAPTPRTISHEVLVRVSRWAKAENLGTLALSSLLRLTTLHAPPLPPRTRLLAILSALELAQDEASYASMTSLHEPQIRSLLPLNDVHEMRKGGKERTVAEEWAEVRREVGAIVNVAASMLAVGVAIWWVGGGRSYADRLSLAMGGAMLIGAMEGFLYYRFFSRETPREAGKMEGARGKLLQFDPVEVPDLARKLE